MKVIVTGGAGFIGSALIRRMIDDGSFDIVNVDNLTYSGNLENLTDIESSPRYIFEKVDICDKTVVDQLFNKHQPDAVMHLAAESHVDRSIDDPSPFIHTNILGTFNLLESARAYIASKSPEFKDSFRFLHVSTDEVYGSLNDIDYFTEESSYQPNSPYSASKASSDMLVRAWFHTYKLPVITTNCSNNYGPNQFPEKLIPLMILNALEGKGLPVYGTGRNIRDWLYVDDHADALICALLKGKLGEVYNIGSRNERTNLEIVEKICEVLDALSPREDKKSYKDQINFVADRPGHDKRYAIDPTKIENELEWSSKYDFESGLKKTIEWYLANRHGWCKNVLSGSYKLQRLGSGAKELEL